MTKQLIRFKTISEFHRLANLPKPQHPLITLVDLKMMGQPREGTYSRVYDFYSISLKKTSTSRCSMDSNPTTLMMASSTSWPQDR